MVNPPLTSDNEIDLHAILDQAPLQVAFLDLDRRLRYANRRFAEFHGQQRDQLIGKTIGQIRPSEKKELQSKLNQTYSGDLVNYQIQLRDGSGGLTWVDITHTPRYNSQNEIVGCYLFVDDGSRSPENDRIMNLVFRNAPCFIALIDRRLRFRYVNQNYLESLGLPHSEVVGKPLEEVLAPATFQAARPNLQMALRGEKRVFENTLIGRDGSVMHVLVHLIPEQDSFGKITGLCALLVDRSALKHAREELERKELRIQSAVEGSSVGIIEFDFNLPDWVFAEHVESLLGLDPGELQNSRSLIRQRIHPDDLALNDQARAMEARGQNTAIEIRLKTKSNGYRWFAINSRIIAGTDTAPRRVIGTISDIDALKKAQLKATQDLQRRDEFLAMLSHELRNPMAAITFSLDCINECDQLPDDARNLLDIISRQTTQMSKLLTDLLDVSRLTKNRIQFDFVSHDLNQSIQDVVNSIRPQIAKKHQNLHLHIATESLPIRGDVTRLKQAMANLLDNASKYTPEEGEIWLDTRRIGETIEFSVRDTGEGIAPSSQASIFEIFYQAPSPARKRAAESESACSWSTRLCELIEGPLVQKVLASGKGADLLFGCRRQRPVKPVPKNHQIKPRATAGSCWSKTIRIPSILWPGFWSPADSKSPVFPMVSRCQDVWIDWILMSPSSMSDCQAKVASIWPESCARAQSIKTLC
jgi:PAS domain S-box-containing protein